MSEQRMNELIALINRYNLEYYTFDAPSVSDAEYDALYDELRDLEALFGALPESPTNSVGGKILTSFGEHKHIERLWSLDKAKSFEQIRAWFARCEKTRLELGLKPLKFSLEYKFDGLTINCTYEGGRLAQAATRGNGVTGEAILEQAKAIKSLPRAIEFPGTVEIQGEVIMRLSTLQRYNETTEGELLKNARNAAAGALRNLDTGVTASRNLEVFFYNIGYCDEKFENSKDIIDFIGANKLPHMPWLGEYDSVDDIFDAIQRVSEDRGSLDFLIDGLVIKIIDIDTRDALGFTEKFPRWAIAYKFPSQEMTTVIKDVVWQVGRTGKLTPLALLDPVDIGGVTVKKATLNNFGDILRKKVSIGARIIVRRSNDVIPEILGITDESTGGKAVEIPIECPACHAHLEKRGAHLFCMNTLSCKPQIVGRIVHFCSRDAMNIETLSFKTDEQICDKLKFSNIAQLFSLKQSDLLDLEGFKEKRAHKLLKEIENSKTRPLSAFVYALGIPNVGLKAAKELANTFESLEKIINADYESIISIYDFGDAMASSIVSFFTDPKIKLTIDEMISCGVRPTYEASKKVESMFSGKTVVLTGALEKYDRKQASEYIEKLGGKTASSVSKKTDFVIAGEAAGSKLDKAREYKIVILNENDFDEIIQNSIVL